MSESFRLVLGTNNRKKREELVTLIGDRNVELFSLDDFPAVVEVEETGTTFQANAELKAIGYAAQTGEWVLAEDSGLSVSALDGNPGVYSARFSGEDATDESNNDLLIEKLDGKKNRNAWYTCHIAISDPGGIVVAKAEARCHGQIMTERRGTSGFGYDPLFEIPEYDLTFAQLGTAVKSVLSHRGRAYRKILPQLVGIINRNQESVRTT